MGRDPYDFYTQVCYKINAHLRRNSLISSSVGPGQDMGSWKPLKTRPNSKSVRNQSPAIQLGIRLLPLIIALTAVYLEVIGAQLDQDLTWN